MAIDGDWTIMLSTPMGERKEAARLAARGASLSGSMTNESGDTPVENGSVDGDHLFWRTKMTQPLPMTLEFDVDVEGDALSGTVKFGRWARLRSGARGLEAVQDARLSTGRNINDDGRSILGSRLTCRPELPMSK